VPFGCVCVAATLQGALLQSNPLTFQILESIIVLSLNASFLEHSVRVASGPNSKHPPPSKDRNGSSLPRNPLSSSWFRCVRATALRIVWGKAGLGRYIEQKERRIGGCVTSHCTYLIDLTGLRHQGGEIIGGHVESKPSGGGDLRPQLGDYISALVAL
jgi:hypothetical protein